MLPFVEMWEQHSVSFLQWGAPIHTGIIKCFGSNVQLILAGVLRIEGTAQESERLPERLVFSEKGFWLA